MAFMSLEILLFTRSGVKRTDKALRGAITMKGIEWFGERFFSLQAGKVADKSVGMRHIYCSETENEFFTSARCTDLDIYHNSSCYPVECTYYRDTKRVLTVFGDIKPLMKMMPKELDVLSLGSAPLTALHALLPRSVIVPVDALLVVKGDILRKFIYDI